MPTEAESLNDALNDAASNPRQAQFDGGMAISHSIPDLIALDKHQAAKRAASNGNPFFGLQFAQIKPGGAG